MRRAAALTNLLEYEALDAIVPGKTTNGDLQDQMRARLTALGFGDAWTDNPGIQSGLDRGRGSDAKRLMIPGDVIDIDFGIKVHGMWCTDVQRFAYILMPGEHEPPQQIRYAWESARQSSRRMRAAMRPGVKGWEIDKVQIDWMLSRGSLLHPFRTGHPVGYWAHDVGPSISGYTPEGPPPTGDAARAMEPGMTFSFDGNYVWPATDGPDTGTRSITSEEMAVITATGAEYLSPVQETLVVIPTRR
jgi:Xaa-Pro aminopeptidase